TRFVHYLMIMARDKIGSLMDLAGCERSLNEWINQFVLPSPPSATPAFPSRYPLAEARVEIRRMRERPERAELVVWARLRTHSHQTGVQRFLAEVPMRTNADLKVRQRNM